MNRFKYLILSITFITLLFGFSQTARAVWIDAKTGEPVQVEPYIDPLKGIRNGNPDEVPYTQAHYHGFNLYWDKECKTWKDAKTGKEVQVEPYIDPLKGIRNGNPDEVPYTQAHYHGLNLVWVPCPEEASSTTTPPPGGGVKTASAPALFNVGLGYSYMHADAEEVQNLNGFAVSGFYNVNSWLAFGGEFSGLYGTETQNYTDGSVKTSLDRYLYLFGPQVTFHPCNRTTIYGRVLAGGVHDCNDVTFPGGSYYSTGNAFAMAAGAGVDVRVTRHFSIGPSFDYVPTHFITPNGNNWQNNWRVGLTAKFSF